MLDWVVPLLTLTAMEIVLGIDNVIFIAIVVGKLPEQQRSRARRLGLGAALGIRVVLLLALFWIIHEMTSALFSLTDLGIPTSWLGKEDNAEQMKQLKAVNEISWRDLILLGGGLFLIGKSTYEIHDSLEGAEEKPSVGLASRFGWILVQIIILDIIFSLDSVITAIGMAQQIWIMVTAMIVAVGVMLFFAGAISSFVHRHPTIKMLALAFLILIGVMLVAEAFEKHIDRGYIYFAMAFSLGVEMLNLRLRAKGRTVELSTPNLED